jgi:hypothetical protein
MSTGINRRSAGDDRWDRLQTFLLGLQPGHIVTVGALAQSTGLEADTVEMVLQALTRASLFRPNGRATFVRQRLHVESG